MKNKLKILIAKTIFIVVMINIIFPYTIFSNTTAMSLVVNSNIVTLINQIQLVNGRYYVSTNDISNLGIEIYSDKGYSYEFCLYNSNMYFYGDSNYIYINGKQLYDVKPSVKVENITYIAIDLIAISFGNNYTIDEENSVISMDLANPYFQTISGRISLPNNEVAPSEGLSVTVFCGNVVWDSNSYMYSIQKTKEIQLNIPSGANGVDYSIVSDTGNGVAVGYTISNSNYSSGYYVKGEIVDKLGTISPRLSMYSDINITILSSRMFVLSGKIQLPEAYDNSNGVSLVLSLLSGQYSENIRDTIYMNIPSGAKSADFNLKTRDMNTSVTIKYSIQNSTSGLWKTGYYAQNNAVMYYGSASFFDTNSNVSDVIFNIMSAKTLTAKIKLPYGMIAKGNIRASLYLVPHIEPQQMLVNTDNNITLSSSSGSSPVSSPSGGGGSSGGGGTIGISVPAPLPVAVEMGSTKGELQTNLPVLGNQKYELSLIYITGDDRFYKVAYYTQNGSASYAKDMLLVDENTGSIDITLLKQNTIYGKLLSKPTDKQFVAYAIPQVVENQKSTLEDFVPFCDYSYCNSYNSLFVLKVPEDVNQYIVGYKETSGTYLTNYYSQNGTVDNISGADIITVSNDINGIDMTFVGNRPTIPITIFNYSIRQNVYNQTSTTYANVSLQNLSDYNEDATVYMVGYDSQNKIAKTFIGNVTIASNIYGNINIPLSNGFKDSIAYSKLFMWDKAMIPLSLPSQELYTDGTGTTEDITVMVNNAVLNFDAKPVMIQKEIICPLRGICEALGTAVSWEADTETIYISKGNDVIILQVDNTKATINGDIFEINVSPKIIDGRVFAPIVLIAKLLNYSITWDGETSTLSINMADAI